MLTCLVFVSCNRSRVPRDTYSSIAVLIFHKASQHCCDGPGIILFRRTMDEEKKILEAELLAPLQMVDIFIVIVSLIHQEGGGGAVGVTLLSSFHVWLGLSSQVEITPVS